MKLEDFEIGRILHLKFEIRNPKLDMVQSTISDFEFQMQDSSNFKSQILLRILIELARV